MPSFSLRRCQRACLITSLSWAAACSSRPFQAVDPKPETQVERSIKLNSPRDVDILFMVDNSLSMEQEQVNLGENFPVFINELRKIEGGMPNLHIAVVSSDMGAGPTNQACSRVAGDVGRFFAKPACGLLQGAQFIKSYNRESETNWDSQKTLQQVFSCMADLGTEGCGFEHQLQSVAVALSNFNASNQGFLRPDALLGIILITDEDDCSAEPTADLFTDPQFPSSQSRSLRCNLVGHACNGMSPMATEFRTPLDNCTASSGGGRLIDVKRFVDQIKSLKRDPDRQIVVSAITGKPADPSSAQYGFHMADQFGERVLDVAPICSTQVGGTAAPALRLTEFVKAFGVNGSVESICNDDFSGALARIAELLGQVPKVTCMEAGLLDVDPAREGMQVDCTVEDEVPGSNGAQKLNLPACGPGAQTPCWKLLKPKDPGNTCGEKYAIDVDRGGAEAVPHTLQSIKCRGCAKTEDSRCP